MFYSAFVFVNPAMHFIGNVNKSMSFSNRIFFADVLRGSERGEQHLVSPSPVLR